MTQERFTVSNGSPQGVVSSAQVRSEPPVQSGGLSVSVRQTPDVLQNITVSVEKNANSTIRSQQPTVGGQNVSVSTDVTRAEVLRLIDSKLAEDNIRDDARYRPLGAPVLDFSQIPPAP